VERREFLKILGITTLISPSFALDNQNIYLNKKERFLLLSVLNKLNKIQSIVGYGNFNIIGFDKSLKIAKYHSFSFTKEELNFIEKIFYENQEKYNFFGKKTMSNLTSEINTKEIIKIKGTGHYLFKHSLNTYHKMLKDVDNIHLTSGVRSVVKQMKLYLGKIYRSNGNITKAIKSIVPPAYSYHSVGDFDVGRIDWGYKNFTAQFGNTPQYKKICKLNYIKIRYTKNNRDGVRFEPWHITIV